MTNDEFIDYLSGNISAPKHLCLYKSIIMSQYIFVRAQIFSIPLSNTSVSFDFYKNVFSVQFFFHKFIYFIYLFLAVLGLCCCARAFLQLRRVGATLRCGARAPYCSGFSCYRAWSLGTRALVVAALRLSSCSAWGLVALQHVGSSRTRDQTCVPCIGRRILNHCGTREALQYSFMYFIIPQSINVTIYI